MKKLILIIANLFIVPYVMADVEEMTDREILSLYMSTHGEETALRSILPKEQFKLKVVMKDLYDIIDRESPELQIPGLKSTHRYTVEACMQKEKSKDGVCLHILLNGSDSNIQKLRTLKNSGITLDFFVGLWSIIEIDHLGGKFKVLKFAEKMIL